MTALGWVYFFLGGSVLSLLVAAFFARQVDGSGIGTADMEKISAPKPASGHRKA